MEKDNFFSIKGRLRRRGYVIRAILISIPAEIINVASKNSQESGLLIFVVLIMLVRWTLTAIQAIKRLHDINMSGWYWLIFLIPIANLIFALYVIFKDGTPGPNKYGEDPKGRHIIETI